MTASITVVDLVTEYAEILEPDGPGTRPAAWFRPAGRPLLNDGMWSFWMLPGETYRLAFDGTGWVTSCPSWVDAHVRRLATLAGSMAATLPVRTDAGALTLDPAHTYALQPSGVDGWSVQVCGSDHSHG